MCRSLLTPSCWEKPSFATIPRDFPLLSCRKSILPTPPSNTNLLEQEEPGSTTSTPWPILPCVGEGPTPTPHGQSSHTTPWSALAKWRSCLQEHSYDGHRHPKLIEGHLWLQIPPDHVRVQCGQEWDGIQHKDSQPQSLAVVRLC